MAIKMSMVSPELVTGIAELRNCIRLLRHGNIFLKTMYIYQDQEQKCKKCDYTQNYIKPPFYFLRARVISIYGLPDTQETTEAD